jgi:hypothetical protein
MMRSVSATAFVQSVEARKRSVGVTDEAFARVRNNGRRRTAEKRALLARVQERARNRGLEPVPANF